MPNSFFQLDLATTVGDKVDAWQLIVDGQTVKRERHLVAGVLDVEIAEVKNAAPTSGMYGLIVRNIPSGLQATSLNGVVDGNNSTSAPLGGGGVFTGVATEIKDYVAITVFAFSNVASAANGLAVQFSTDGTNWDHQHLHGVSAGAVHSFAIKAQARYYRIVYTNGGSAQSSFRLQAILNPASSSGTVQPVGELPIDSDDALLTQSTIVGRTTAGGGAYVPVKVNPSGALTVAASQDTTPWVIAGGVAHNAVDTAGNNPAKGGAQARQTNPTAVADADVTNLIADDIGRQLIKLNAPRDLQVRQTTTLTTTGETTILTAGAGGIFHEIDAIVVTNTSATDVRVDFRDATAGSVIFSLYARANDMRGVALPCPIPQAAAANNWTAQLSGAVTDVRILVLGHKTV